MTLRCASVPTLDAEVGACAYQEADGEPCCDDEPDLSIRKHAPIVQARRRGGLLFARFFNFRSVGIGVLSAQCIDGFD